MWLGGVNVKSVADGCVKMAAAERCGAMAKEDTSMTERIYTTRSSAHGSDFVPLSNPERYEMTLEEAEADVRFWRAHADTVGGDAIVVKQPNDE